MEKRSNSDCPPQTMVIHPGEGETIHAFGDTALIKLNGEQTNGQMMAMVTSCQPGDGPPPHRHSNEDEMFLVMDGKIQYLANGAWTEPLEPGTIVYTPRGLVHTFRNGGQSVSRQLIIATPNGFEKFFSECAKVFAAATAAGGLDMARIIEISTQHGIEYVPPLVSPQ